MARSESALTTRADLKAELFKILRVAVIETSGDINRDLARVRLLLRRFELVVEREGRMLEWVE